MMLFPTKAYLEAIQILPPDIVRFLTYHAPSIEQKWSKDRYLFSDKPTFGDIADYIKMSPRVKNLLIEGEIRKTDLLMAFRSDMQISELSARRIIQHGIETGLIKERATERIKWISA